MSTRTFLVGYGPAEAEAKPWRRAHGGTANRAFILSASGIFVFTALLKGLSLTIGGSQLKIRDPLILFLDNGKLLGLVAAVEIAVAIAIFMSKNIIFANGLIAWVSTLFLLYRIGLLLIGYKGTCFCAGWPQSWLVFAKELRLDPLMKILLGYLFLSSYAFLIYHWWNRGRRAELNGSGPVPCGEPNMPGWKGLARPHSEGKVP